MSSSYERRILTKATLTHPDDEIVISGIAGRFPNSDNVSDFAFNLYNKVDMVDDDERRWRHTNPEVPKRSGKINRLEKFDAFFFSVHHRQANLMDPQCRMLLEHSYEAVLDAGINPKSLRESRTGVFIGCCFAESEETMYYTTMIKDGLGLTGSSRAMLANRVSFSLGLRGPSFTIDTACSSSMYALDCAFNAIRSGECDAALVGGTNLLLHPNITLQFARLGVLAKDGFCRPFDKHASGYSRSEAVSIIFLQKRCDAVRVYADLVYSKTNNDGFKKEAITYPSGQMQIKLLKEFYDDLKMDTSLVEYVEAHSTGTKVGDPEECHTLDEVFCKVRNGRPLLTGSVKSNMGHSEATSGICSIVKVILAFEKKLIAPNLHYVGPKVGIASLEQGRLEVVTETRELEGSYVCINSFGFGGGNAHSLYRGNVKEKINHGIPNDSLPRLVVWSGRTEEAISAILDSVTKQQLDAEYVAMLHNIQVTTISSNTYRGYGLFTQNGNIENAKCIGQHVQHFDGVKRPIVWVYSGMGSQWCKMGTDLLKIPIFADAIDNCHNILLTKGLDLKKIITSKDSTMFDNILHSFVGIAAIQIGLTDVLKALNIEPDYIIGHSVGELGCAYADGCFTAEEMILSAYSRGMASIETKVVFGSMAAVGLGFKKLRTILPDGVEIACHNSADSSTISGPADLIATFVAELKKQNHFAKEVACSNIPYHSPYIAEMGPKLFGRLTAIIKTPKKRSAKWISSSVPKSKWDSIEAQFSSADYHTNNLLSLVLFEEASELLPKDALTIEIAPHGLLQAILKGSLPDAVNIGLTKRGNKENTTTFMNALGKIFENGVDMDLSKLYPRVEFPVSRGTPMIAPLIKWDHSEDRFVTRFEDKTSSQRLYTVNISDPEYDYISGHTIDGRILFPATGYLFLAWHAVADMARIVIEDCDVEFEDVQFLRATYLTKNKEIDFDVIIQKGTCRFQINEGSNAVVTGIVRATSTQLTSLDHVKEKACPVLPSRDFYKELRLRGYHYSGLFKSIVNARADGQGGKIKWDSNWIAFLDCLLQMHIIGKDTRSLMLPTALRKVVIKPKEHQAFLDAITEEEKVLDVKSSKQLNIMRCGGIEMRGLQASLVSRRRPPGIPVLETYEFIPHLPTPSMTKVNLARFCVQLALENVPTPKVLTVEVDENDEKEPLSDFFGQALGDLPLVTGELNYISSKPLDLGITKVQDCSISTFNNITFIIKSEVLSDIMFLESATNLLKDGGFIVAREKSSSEKLIFNNLPTGYQVIAAIPSNEELIVLLQYFKSTPTGSNKVVKVTTFDYEWLETLKKEVSVGPVIAYSEKEELSGIIGLVNCIRKEPNGLNLRCVFVDDHRAPSFDVSHPFYKSQLDRGLAINVFRNGQWGSYRHLLLLQKTETIPRKHHCYANSLVKGDLSSMTWLDGPYNHGKRSKGDQVVRVQYASLNFRDVMLATGKLSVEVYGSGRLDQLCTLGLEYSGIGRNNKRIMGMVISGALATHIQADDTLLWEVPDEWSLEEAATIPVVYCTAYVAFFIACKIEKGKAVLIHAGSGGVGLAAIRIALGYGLEVFTTVSTEEKKQFLLNEFPLLKRENIGNSRDTSFEDLVMMRTNGKGVDYVLNSLAGDKLHASIRCLGKGGKFLEIGKFDLSNDTKIGLADFLKELSFSSVLVDNMFTASLEEKMALSLLLKNDIKKGIVKPLKRNVYNANDIESAFRFLASGKHVGKVLLKVRENEWDESTLPISVLPRVYCHPDKTYIIPGGLGGFGLELADWLVIRGCRKLVLSSSRGITKQYQAYRIGIWESYTVKVEVNTSDISTRAGCEKLIKDVMKLGPVGGIFNLAVILKDSIFENQDEQKFIESMAPKAVATKHLDELSRIFCPDLHFFVIFSSVSCGRGNAGQSNYGMANSIMERIIEQRHQLGLPAKAIQWGAVGEVGLVADMIEDKLDMEIGGTLQQRISSCLEELDPLMTVDSPIVASMVVAEKRYSAGGKGNILDAIMNIMSIRDIKSLSMETTLSELGMDSLMTVEIQQTLEREFDLVIAAQELRSMSLSQLVKCANCRDSSDQAKLKIANQNVPTGVAMLLRNLGDETHSDKTILQLESLSQDVGVKVLILPGIEGMAGKAWYSVAKNLNCPTYVLQCKKTWDCCDLESIYDGVINDVLELYANDEEFIIVGYSFGAMLSIHLARALEAKEKLGKLILLDASPKFLKTLAVEHVPKNYTEETLQAFVLLNTIQTVFPDDNGEKVRLVLSEPSWDSRVSKLIEISEDKKPYSNEYGTILLNSMVNRMKLTLSIDLTSFPILKKTPLTLIRPSEFSLLDIEEDYALSAYTTEKIKIKFIEGNHITILENPKLFDLLNSYLPSF